MAVAGILGQELLGVKGGTKWFEAGAAEYDLPVIAQVPILFLVMGFLETKRYQGWKETGTVSDESLVASACSCMCGVMECLLAGVRLLPHREEAAMLACLQICSTSSHICCELPAHPVGLLLCLSILTSLIVFAERVHQLLPL